MRNIIMAVLVLTLAPLAAAAQADGSLVGKWKTIDDETSAPRSIVEITEANGELQGRILQIFYRPDEKPDPVCEACEAERKGQPVIGMTFLWGLKPDGSNEWASGSVLDPKNGKIYNAKATLTEAGRKLRLRGFIGTPILGRTQIWLREP